MASYTPNLNLYKPDSTDDYEDFREGFNENMDKLDQGGGNQNIATDYDDTQTYAVGDYVIYDGLLYKCDTAVTTAETFDPTKWTHVVVTDEMGSGGGSGGHTIYDKNGTALAQENGLQFTGAVSVSDDSVNGRTVVDITGGGGNYYLNTIFSTEEKKIGYWKDGKPLYQRVFDLGSDVVIYPDSLTNTSIDASQMQTLVDAWGIYSTGVTKYSLMANINNNVIRLQTDRNGASASVRYVVLQYTKTADTADPNPQVGNVIYLPTIYSEEERQVGVWTDGKPLYQKTILYDCANNSNVQTAYTIPSTHFIVNVSDAYFQNSTGGLSQQIRYTWASVHFWTYVVNNSAHVILIHRDTNDSNWQSGVKFFITIQYTKTTDVAGSGNWNTDGVPTHHYTTNEQVIGTWIDGKPLYEKTYTGLNQSITGNQWNTISGVSMPINEIIDVRAYRIADGHLTSIGLKEYSQITQSGVRLVPLSTETLDTLIIQYTKTTD